MILDSIGPDISRLRLVPSIKIEKIIWPFYIVYKVYILSMFVEMKVCCNSQYKTSPMHRHKVQAAT